MKCSWAEGRLSGSNVTLVSQLHSNLIRIQSARKRSPTFSIAFSGLASRPIPRSGMRRLKNYFAIYAIYPAKEPSQHSTPSLSITPLTSYPGNEVQPGISPDGNQVAFAFNDGRSSNYHIYVKGIGSEEIRRLTSDRADDLSPSWS